MKLFCLIIFTVVCYGGFSQSPPLRNFSVKEGLPSGIVYDCLEDRKGFMWFATEAGLARFDGINFKTYTTEDGLSNNSILQIIEDDDGSIWIFPFGTSPCIFDWKQQRIITAKENAMLAELGKFAEHLSAIKISTGLIIYAEGILFIAENRRLKKMGGVKEAPARPFYFSDDSLYTVMPKYNDKKGTALIQHFSKAAGGWTFHYEDSISFPVEDHFFAAPLTRSANFENYKLFLSPHHFSVYDVGNWARPGFNRKATYSTKGQLNAVQKAGGLIYLCTTSGVLRYNMNFKRVDELWPEHSFSKFYLDRKGNQWYCKLDGSGVLMALGNGVMTINKQEGLPVENISAVYKKEAGGLIAGDASGNISVLSWKEARVSAGTLVRLKSGIRQILRAGNKHVALADRELALISNGNVSVKENLDVSFKAAAVAGDDSLLIGHSAGIFKSGFSLKNSYPFSVPHKRVSTISYFADTVFFGNNKGLFYIPGYRKHHENKSIEKATAIIDPVTTVSAAGDGILWAGTNTLGVVVYRNNKINTWVPYKGVGGNYIIKRIFTEPVKKRVWVATNKGLQLISYHIAGDSVTTSSQFITSKDGLADDDVNDVAVSGDTVFAATIKGINYFTDTLKPLLIPININGITLNDRDSALPATASCTINYSRSSFSIHYSGICFTCDGKIMYKYRLLGTGRDTSWITTPVNTVEFGGLQPGRYLFQVTTDASEPVQTEIIIKPAFWQKKWFYILAGLAFTMVVWLAVSWYVRRLKKNNERRVALNKKFSELELRALQSQMNPHFIFNSLNSLQKFILTNDIHNANEYLAGFSKLLRLFLDASRSRFITVGKEIEMLRQYIALEQLRQMTTFSYELVKSENVDTGMLIPSAIIQPFVENAIVHGLRYLEGRPGKLTVKMAKEGDLFTCIIEDNGAGRKKVKEIQQQKVQQYKSFGTAIIEEKIEALHKMENIDINVNVTDRDEAEGTGTIVTITYKSPDNL